MVGRFITATLVALAVTACSDSVPTATSDPSDTPRLGVTVQQLHSDVEDRLIFNPCEPELVKFSGKVHRVIMIRDDGTIELRINYAALKGVGQTTGDEYVVQLNTHVVILDDLPFPIKQVVDSHNRAISRGKAQNFDLVFHETLDIAFDGAPAVITDLTVSTSCRGSTE
jgi:hypothetical protein